MESGKGNLPPHPFAKGFPDKYSVESENFYERTFLLRKEQERYRTMLEERYLLARSIPYLDIIPRCKGIQLPSLFECPDDFTGNDSSNKVFPSIIDRYGPAPEIQRANEKLLTEAEESNPELKPTISKEVIKSPPNSLVVKVDNENEDDDTITEIASETEEVLLEEIPEEKPKRKSGRKKKESAKIEENAGETTTPEKRKRRSYNRKGNGKRKNDPLKKDEDGNDDRNVMTVGDDYVKPEESKTELGQEEEQKSNKRTTRRKKYFH